jgi:PhoH-like ATPase
LSNKKRNYQQNQFYPSEYAPKILTEHPFYGLNLDPEQQIFRDAIWDPEKTVVICDAKSGSGKTTIALGTANLLVQYGLKDGIIYIMTPTQEQTQGYLPGTIEEKSAPYMQPLIDAMITLDIPSYALQTEDNIQAMKSGDAYIQFTVDTFLRGCNLENKVIIVDEIQNFYFNTLKKTLTRIHDSCKVVLIGSHIQSDIIKHKERSGFDPYFNAFRDEIMNKGPNSNRIAICELHTNHRGWFSNFCDEVPDPNE